MVKLNIKDVIPFKNHPYSINEDEELKELLNSINNIGMINPIIVRKQDNKFEILSGHRRVKACEILKLKEIPATIVDLNDDEATILMVDSNLHREKILPSEKAFAYKMRFDAQKRIGVPRGHKVRDVVAEQINVSSTNIQRYIRLTYLIPEILSIVDQTSINKGNSNITMGIKPAVELSYLNNKEQKMVYDEMIYQDLSPSHAQTIKLRKLSKLGKLDDWAIEEVLSEEKGNQHEKISFNKEKIMNELPEDLSKRDKRYIEEYIINAIKTYREYDNERGDSYDIEL